MALIHYFLLLSSDVSIIMAKYQEKYIIDGRMKRFAYLEDVPNPIDCTADDTAGEILMDFYMRNKIHALGLQDKYICKNLLEFRTVETYFTGFIPCMGLNYYGFTLIPWGSLPAFICILRYNSVRNSYGKLVALCQEAYKMKRDVLHCGV